MTSPHQKDPAGAQPQYADRVYRSLAGVIGGVLLLALAAWLGSDAVFRGEGRTPWLSLAGLLLAVPLIVAFTVRPAVYAGSERIRIRNPFRTITLPWSAVDRVRAAYSTELYSGTHKYQLWAIPVSLRARKRAARQTARAKVAGDPFGGSGARKRPAARDGGDPVRSWSDTALDELRELSDRHPVPEEGQPRQEPSVRWCYEVIGPAAAGAIVLAVLLAV